MPGLAVKINFESRINSEKCLEKVSNAYKVPSISYKEKHLSDNNAFFYSLLPEFIAEERIEKVFDGRYIIAIDGDYYNQAELNSLLNLHKTSKLETLLHLYLDKGEKFAELINGEFIIIIYDLKNKEVVVTNDRFARRTFFWYKKDQSILFASEKKGILALGENIIALDEHGLLEMFTFRHNLDGRTFIKDLSSLKPATVLQLKNNKIFEKKYFNWVFNTENKRFNDSEIIKEIHTKLKKSIKRRINEKEKILLLLSGGYDSRAIACSIEKDKREKVKTVTFGEEGSDELAIAQKVSDILKFEWNPEKVKNSYIQLAKFGAWRTEFAISAMGHPFIGNHIKLKRKADYILSGLPGLDVLNGAHIRIKKIFHSISNNFYDKWYIDYALMKDELPILFEKDFLDKYSNIVKTGFFSTLNNIDAKKRLDKWDIFNITQRQPNFSNISDLCENDLFETLHPYCDTDLIETFLKIPLRKRLFMQLSKNFLYKYFPEVRSVDYNGRGKIKNNNSLPKSFLLQLKNIFFRGEDKTVMWDKTQAIKTEYKEIKKNISFLLEKNIELKDIFNYKSIFQILENKESVIKHSYSIGMLITFLFTYEYLLKSSHIQPSEEYIKNYITKSD